VVPRDTGGWDQSDWLCENLMPRTNAPSPVVEREPVPLDGAELGDVVEFAWIFLRRQYPVLLFCVLLAIAVVGIYLLVAAPRYTAHTVMILDARKGQFFQQQSILADAPTDMAGIESQEKIVKSENIADTVIKNLHLTGLPEFVGSEVNPFNRLLGFMGARPQPPRSEFELMRQAVDVFERSLEVARVDMSYVLNVRFTCNDADRAADIANAVADTYIVDQLDAKFHATQRASNWLQDRANGLRDQASAAEKAVVAFKQANGMVTADGRLMNEQRVADLNTQLVLARGQTAAAQARLNRIETVINADSTMTSNASITDALGNPIMTKLRQQYFDPANREAAWSARYGRNHLAVVNLRDQIQDIRNSMLQELRQFGQTYKSDYEIARQRQESLETDLALAVSQSEKTNNARVTLHELESSAQGYRTLHDAFLQRYTESVQQRSFQLQKHVLSRGRRGHSKRVARRLS
jgi:polysaccharide biosynthesis transport protein